MQVKPSIPSRVEYKLNSKRGSSSFITGAPKHKNEPKYRREYITQSYLNKKQGNPEDGKPEECTLCQLSKTTLTSTRALPVTGRITPRNTVVTIFVQHCFLKFESLTLDRWPRLCKKVINFSKYLKFPTPTYLLTYFEVCRVFQFASGKALQDFVTSWKSNK